MGFFNWLLGSSAPPEPLQQKRYCNKCGNLVSQLRPFGGQHLCMTCYGEATERGYL